jgi:nucleoid-associated protein YgaU
VGDETLISADQVTRIRNAGAELVQRISGDPVKTREILDSLVVRELRFLEAGEIPEPPDSEPEFETYTVQPGDSLSRIALQFYGKSSLWRVIFEANQHILSDPSAIRVGTVLRIPTQPG